MTKELTELEQLILQIGLESQTDPMTVHTIAARIEQSGWLQRRTTDAVRTWVETREVPKLRIEFNDPSMEPLIAKTVERAKDETRQFERERAKKIVLDVFDRSAFHYQQSLVNAICAAIDMRH